ncbi:MAG: type IV pilus assembly protein PilW [Oleispira sp.]|jgi:type IV pilus assembly protein PilW
MKRSQNQQGFTLIELMITLVLSLLVTYGMAQVLISSNQSSSTSDGVSQAQETARFVMSYLGGQIRQSGLDSITNDEVNTRAVMGCDIAALNAINACPSESNVGATEANITVAAGELSGDRFAIARVPPPGVTTDCTGSTIAGFAADNIIVNVFWVSFDDTANSNSLFCQGHLFDGTNVIESGAEQAIANGVEALHVLYGEASAALPSNSERNVSRYVNADQVIDWERVYAIKIAVMTRSISDITNAITRKQYVMLDAGLYNLNDAVNYQIFTSTFAISNFQD